MLQSIRDHIQGWVAGIIIAILSLTFALWGVQNYLGSHSGKNRALVKFKHGKITVQQFQRYYRQVVSNHPEMVSLSGPAKQILQHQVLNQMMQKQALLDALKEDGFSISEQQVRQVILTEPAFQVNGEFSKKRFQQLLYANSMDELQFIQQMQNDLVLAQLKSGLQNSTITTPSQVTKNYRLMMQKRDFGYFIVPAHLFDKQVKPTDRQLQQYYEAHTKLYQQPEQVQVKYLVLSPQKIASAIPVSDQQVEKFYQGNKAHFRTQRKWMIADITQEMLQQHQHFTAALTLDDVEKQLKSGKAFRSYRSQQRWISASDTDQASLVKAVAKMKVGSVSGIIQDDGIDHIVRLIAVQDPEQQPLAQVRAKIKQTLQMQQAQEQFSDQADQLSNLTYTSPNSLQPAAKALGIKVQTSPLFDRDHAPDSLSKSATLAVVFNPDTISSGNNSSPINLDDGTMLVVRVVKHVTASTKPLDQVKTKVRSALVGQLAAQQALKLAASLKVQLASGKQPQVLAKQHRIIWSEMKGVNHSNTSVPTSVISTAFFMPYDSKNREKNLKVVGLQNGDTALVELQAVHVPTSNLADGVQRQALAKKLRDFDGQLEVSMFAKSATKQSDAKVNESLLSGL